MTPDTSTHYMLRWRRSGWSARRFSTELHLSKRGALKHAYALVHATSRFEKSPIVELQILPVVGIVGAPLSLPDELIHDLGLQPSPAPVEAGTSVPRFAYTSEAKSAFVKGEITKAQFIEVLSAADMDDDTREAYLSSALTEKGINR